MSGSEEALDEAKGVLAGRARAKKAERILRNVEKLLSAGVDDRVEPSIIIALGQAQAYATLALFEATAATVGAGSCPSEEVDR